MSKLRRHERINIHSPHEARQAAQRRQIGEVEDDMTLIHPIVDTIPLVKDPSDGTKNMRIDVGTVSASATRVIMVPDQDVDLTPNTGTFSAAAHASRHQDAGGDAIKLDDLATPDDNTDLDASTTEHGLCPKLNNVATDFLNGQGAWAEPAASHVEDHIVLLSPGDEISV